MRRGFFPTNLLSSRTCAFSRHHQLFCHIQAKGIKYRIQNPEFYPGKNEKTKGFILASLQKHEQIIDELVIEKMMGKVHATWAFMSSTSVPKWRGIETTGILRTVSVREDEKLASPATSDPWSAVDLPRNLQRNWLSVFPLCAMLI